MRAATPTIGASGKGGGVRAFDPDHGCSDEAYGPYLKSLGWSYVSPKGQVRLRADELPRGRLIVRIYRHLVAVIDHVIHDTRDCGGAGRVRVEGYWTAPRSRHPYAAIRVRVAGRGDAMIDALLFVLVLGVLAVSAAPMF